MILLLSGLPGQRFHAALPALHTFPHAHTHTHTHTHTCSTHTHTHTHTYTHAHTHTHIHTHMLYTHTHTHTHTPPFRPVRCCWWRRSCPFYRLTWAACPHGPPYSACCLTCSMKTWTRSEGTAWRYVSCVCACVCVCVRARVCMCVFF